MASLPFLNFAALITLMGMVCSQNNSIAELTRDNLGLYQERYNTKREIEKRNAYVKGLCQKYNLPNANFYFDIRDTIPSTTACVVEKREFLVITTELHSSFKL